MIVRWCDEATARALHQCPGCFEWRVEDTAAISLRAERVGWMQVLCIGVYRLDLDRASRLWESEAAVPGLVRSWKLDLEDELGCDSRSTASVDAN